MPVFELPLEYIFPDPNLARDDGLLAVGGDLDPERLLLAYVRGIFPWYSEGLPILWHSPDPRFVLRIDDLKIGRSLKKSIRKKVFTVKFDADFRGVISACRAAKRPDQDGTWITGEMQRGYERLHDLGYAHSTEVYRDDELVGGLYGVAIGKMYFGESMFAWDDDASKIGFVVLCRQLQRWGFDLVDSQVYTDHLARFGAVEVERTSYLKLLSTRVRSEQNVGEWKFDSDFAALEGLF